MIVGITSNGIEGVPPIEMLALAQVIQPFLGAAGPRWDIVRVPVEQSANQVIVILVDPPQMGQPPFICRASGEGLQNGRLYFRGDGETREPTADELDLLMARGNSRPPAPVELDVSVVGTVVPLIIDAGRTLDEFVGKTRQRLLDAIAGPERDPNRSSESGSGLGLLDPPCTAPGLSAGMVRLVMGQPSAARGLAAFAESAMPESRTEDEYRVEIDVWERRFREAWPDAIEQFVGCALHANEVSVVNKTQTFLRDVEVRLHLNGAVEVVVHEGDADEPELPDLDLPPPPREWGPTSGANPLNLANPINLAALIPPSLHASQLHVPSSTSWKTTGSVDVSIDVGDLRPEATFTSDDGECTLVIRGDVPTAIGGTWTATAHGYNEVFRGEVEVEVAEPALLTDMLRRFLGLE